MMAGAQRLGRVGLVQALIELLGSQPARGQMLAQGGGGPVAVRVGGADLWITGHGMLLSRRGAAGRG